MSLDVWGIPCTEEEGVVFDDPNRKISLKCEDTLTNNDDIEKKNFKAGDKFMVNCVNNCIDSKNDV